MGKTSTVRVLNPLRFSVPDLKLVRGELHYHEDRVSVARSLRDDPLGQMHARRQIGEAQYAAGRRYQETREQEGIGRSRSPGDIREPVSGGQIAGDGLTDRQLAAAKQIARWRRLLGEHGYHLVEAVLIDKRPLRELADRIDIVMGKAATTFVGHRFRECLTTLSRDMGLG